MAAPSDQDKSTPLQIFLPKLTAALGVARPCSITMSIRLCAISCAMSGASTGLPVCRVSFRYFFHGLVDGFAERFGHRTRLSEGAETKISAGRAGHA